MSGSNSLKAYGNNIVTEDIAAPNTTASGIIIAREEEVKTQCVKVIHVGSTVNKEIEVEDVISEGLIVYIRRFSGEVIKHLGKDFRVIDKSSIVATVEVAE